MQIIMKGELIKNVISGAPYFGSVPEAAEAIGCDARTLLSAIKGKPVKHRTVALICKTFGLEPTEVIIYVPTEKVPDIDTEESDGILTKASKAAFDTAYKAINNTLEQYDAYEPEEIFKTLVSLISIYAMQISRVDREFSNYFIDETYKRSKWIHQIWLDEHIDDTSLFSTKMPSVDDPLI